MMVMLHLFVLAWQEWERSEKVGKRPTRPEPAPTQFVWNLLMSTWCFTCPCSILKLLQGASFCLCHFRCFAIICYLPRSFPTSRSSPRSGLNRAKGRSTWRKVVSQVGSWTRSSRWSINNATSSLSTTLAILVMMIANWLTSLGTGCFELFERLLSNSHSSKCLDLSQTTPNSQSLLLLLLLSLLTLVLLLFLSVSKLHRGSEQVEHMDSVG